MLHTDGELVVDGFESCPSQGVKSSGECLMLLAVTAKRDGTMCPKRQCRQQEEIPYSIRTKDWQSVEAVTVLGKVSNVCFLVFKKHVFTAFFLSVNYILKEVI